MSFRLGFPAAACPGCAQPGPPGICVHCGKTVPRPTDRSEGADARAKALAPLLDRLTELHARYRELPEPHIAIAPDQYATAVVDARILKRIVVSMRRPRRLGDLELDDSSEV